LRAERLERQASRDGRLAKKTARKAQTGGLRLQGNSPYLQLPPERSLIANKNIFYHPKKVIDPEWFSRLRQFNISIISMTIPLLNSLTVAPDTFAFPIPGVTIII
jgi:hypothetical protein